MATQVRPTGQCSTNYVAPPHGLKLASPGFDFVSKQFPRHDFWMFITNAESSISFCMLLACRKSITAVGMPQGSPFGLLFKSSFVYEARYVRVRQACILSTCTRTRNQRAVGELPRDDCAYIHKYVVLLSTFKARSCFAIFVCLSAQPCVRVKLDTG